MYPVESGHTPNNRKLDLTPSRICIAHVLGGRIRFLVSQISVLSFIIQERIKAVSKSVREPNLPPGSGPFQNDAGWQYGIFDPDPEQVVLLVVLTDPMEHVTDHIRIPGNIPQL